MRTLFALCLALTLAPAIAEARPRHYVRVAPRAAVRIVVNPWAYGYRPAPRAGWMWVEGYYAADGAWIPGYWAPNYQRPGFQWVGGHWEGERYVEGYWREDARPGFVWVDGYYDRGRWIPGYWAPAGPPQPYPAEGPPPGPPPQDVHHDYDP